MIIITPHLFWGNARTTATFPNHKKSHNPHPEGGRGKGAKMGTLHCAWWGGLPNPIIWNPFSCRNKKPTPSNVIGSLMVIRVLPIHVPPCYGGDTLGPTPLKPYMTYDDHLVWPIHVPRRCEPLITPQLWGNARTRATFPTHKKNHNPHPQGGEGEGDQNIYIYITLGGGGGGPAKPGSYIYIYIYIYVYIRDFSQNFWKVRWIQYDSPSVCNSNSGPWRMTILIHAYVGREWTWDLEICIKPMGLIWFCLKLFSIVLNLLNM